MADTWKSTGEERRFLDLLSKSALEDYPNPERKGCPGNDFLRQLAFDRHSISLDDTRVEHVLHCSPCFRELTELRRQAARKRRRQRLMMFAAASALLAAGAGVWFVLAHDRFSGVDPNSVPLIAKIDLQNRALTRGIPRSSDGNDNLILPRGRLRLTVLLPFASEPGGYEVQVLKEVDKPLVTGSGTAVIENGVTELTLPLDTAALPPGKYLLGIRTPPIDWTFNTVTLQ